MKKIIFLDFDGVINAFDKNSFVSFSMSDFQNPKDIDLEMVKRLNKIIKATGADVVATTSWRKTMDGRERSVEELQEILDSRGFEGKVIDKTPHLTEYTMTRADEIQKWLDNCDEDVHYVVLDDMWKNALKDKFWNNFIFITNNGGLKKHHVKRAINILGRKHELREVQ